VIPGACSGVVHPGCGDARARDASVHHFTRHTSAAPAQQCSCCSRTVVGRPFRARVSLGGHDRRALPWAGLGCPFGAVGTGRPRVSDWDLGCTSRQGGRGCMEGVDEGARGCESRVRESHRTVGGPSPNGATQGSPGHRPGDVGRSGKRALKGRTRSHNPAAVGLLLLVDPGLSSFLGQLGWWAERLWRSGGRGAAAAISVGITGQSQG
jgi:hypothetical protein